MENIDINEVIDTSIDRAKVKLPKRNTFFTIDPYSTINEYNQALEALKNNGIGYTEFISTLGKYYWYLSLEGNQRPIMINYTSMNKMEWTKTVSKTKPLKTNHVYLLYRRASEKSELSKYIDNDWLKIAKRTKSIVFKITSKENLLLLSKTYGRIYPLGVYFNGQLKLAICFNTEIKNSLTSDRIVVEKGPHKTGELELEINYKALRNQDKLIKYFETPYFEDGKFHPTSPQSPLKIL